MDDIYKQPILDAKYKALNEKIATLTADNDELKATHSPSNTSLEIVDSVNALIEKAIGPMRTEISDLTTSLTAAEMRTTALEKRVTLTNKFWAQCSQLHLFPGGAPRALKWLVKNQELVMEHLESDTFLLRVSIEPQVVLDYRRNSDMLSFEFDLSGNYIKCILGTVNNDLVELLSSVTSTIGPFSEKLLDACWARVDHLREFPDSTVPFSDTLKTLGLL